MRKIISTHKILGLSLCFIVMLIGNFLQTNQALAATPVHTETLIAGPYTIDVSLSDDPPFTDQTFEVTVGIHGNNQQLSGSVAAEPGQGTDAVRLQTPLRPQAGSSGKISGWLHIPVRGTWQLIISVNGSQGPASTSTAITVGAPGAISPWLAWVIATTPLILIAWWIYQQRRYRHKLLSDVPRNTAVLT